MDRITTGIHGLDAVVEGGLPVHSLVIIAGTPGTGKTILAQQLIYANARPDAPALYLTTLSEPATKMVRYLQQFTFFDERRVLDAPAAVSYRDIAEPIRAQGLDALPTILAALLAEHRPSFLVIDSFKALRELGALRRALFDVAGELAARACTTLLVGEYTPREVEELPEFAVADGILHLVNRPYGTRDERYLRVVNFQENPPLLRHLAAGFGWELDRRDGGAVSTLYMSPVEMNINEVVQRVVALLEERPIRRVVIDSLGDLEAATSDPVRFRGYVYALMQLLAVRGVTAYATTEAQIQPDYTFATPMGASHVSDNVIALRDVFEDGRGGEPELTRALAVVKHRGGPHDHRIRRFTIGPGGVDVEA